MNFIHDSSSGSNVLFFWQFYIFWSCLHNEWPIIQWLVLVLEPGATGFLCYCLAYPTNPKILIYYYCNTFDQCSVKLCGMQWRQRLLALVACVILFPCYFILDESYSPQTSKPNFCCPLKQTNLKVLIFYFNNPFYQCAMQRRQSWRLLVSEAGATRWTCYCLAVCRHSQKIWKFWFWISVTPLNQCAAVCNSTEAEAASFRGWCYTVPLLLPFCWQA